METIPITKNDLFINASKMQYVKFKKMNGEYIATLTDSFKYEISKGYGKTVIEAINDLHSNFL